MKSVLIVNGEKYWTEYLPGYSVTQKSIDRTSWILKDGKLFVADADEVCQPDGILWRVGAIKPSELQTTALNLIELASVPCVNSAKTLKIGFDRLSMLAAIKAQDLPLIHFNVVTKSTHLKNIQKDYPFVVKVGNYHGGYGKVLVETEKQWQDVKDLLFVTNTYVTVEPYIPYVRDIRYLAIGHNVWAMARKGKYWKANVETTDFEQIEPEPSLTLQLKNLQKAVGADILAIDILEEQNGSLHVVEYNDIPGLSGFGDELKMNLAAMLKAKMA